MQKIPEQLEIVTEVPRNASGKVLKFKLQELFSEAAPQRIGGSAAE